MPPVPLIPAKAGTHIQPLASGQDSKFRAPAWTPASAGDAA